MFLQNADIAPYCDFGRINFGLAGCLRTAGRSGERGGSRDFALCKWRHRLFFHCVRQGKQVELAGEILTGNPRGAASILRAKSLGTFPQHSPKNLDRTLSSKGISGPLNK
jgi:hypothetical protein